MTYFGFLHVQQEHHPQQIGFPSRTNKQIIENKIIKHKFINDIDSGSTDLLSFGLMIRSTILVDPVSQFYQSVFPSLLAFWNENLSKDLTIVLDSDRYYPTYWMDDDAKRELSPILNVIFKKESLPRYWNKLYLTGYDRQQYSTLQLDKYTDKDIIISLDTDSPFYVIPIRSDFINDQNQIKLVASNIYGGIGRQHDWSTSCRLLFGKYVIDGMAMLPQVFHRSTLINFRKYFIGVMRREYKIFIKNYINNNPLYPGIGKDIHFDIDTKYPINNTEMNRTILYILNDPESDKFDFDDAFMFFATNFSNKPYSEYTLLTNYAYLFEHDKYEWHIDNWIINNENKAHQRLTGHWKYAKPITHHYARLSCCHLYINHLLDKEITLRDDSSTYTFCKEYINEWPEMNSFLEDWFINGNNFMSITPENSPNCKDIYCENAKRWTRDDVKTKQRYKMMKQLLNETNGIFTRKSLETKQDVCHKIANMTLNQVYQYIRLRHKGKHGQLPKPLFHHRSHFKEISGGKI